MSEHIQTWCAARLGVPALRQKKNKKPDRKEGRNKEIKTNINRIYGEEMEKGNSERRAAARAQQMESQTRGKKKNLHQTFKVSVTSTEQAFIACDSTLGFIFTPTAAVHVDVSIGTDVSMWIL